MNAHASISPPAEMGAHPHPHFRRARRQPRDRNIPQPWEHVVSVSGGKDSTALYCLAVERGMPFKAVMADTGHEAQETYDAAANLSILTGGPPVQTVKADFTEAMARKRTFILAKWPGMGIPLAHVERAAELLVPTGIPFLDLCMVKGRFPGAKSRFCTDELKLVPMWYGVHKPILESGRTLISWQGVRAQESLARRFLPRWQRNHSPAPFCLRKSEREAAEDSRVYSYRPIHSWTVEDVFALTDRHGIPRHPFYALGASRVGCWPCIFATKDELRVFSVIAKDAVARVEEWERIVGEVSKRSVKGGSVATFFCASDDPLYEDGMVVDAASFGIRAKLDWANTSYGGRQYDMFARSEAMSCSGVGVCE